MTVYLLIRTKSFLSKMNSSSVSSSVSDWTAVGRGGRHGGAGAFSSDAAAAFGGRRAGAGAGRRTADAYQPPSMLRRYDDAPKPAPAPVPFEQAFPSLGGGTAPKPQPVAAKKATTFASLARKCQETDDAAEIRRKIEEEAKARKRMLDEYDARMFARNSASSSYTPYTSSRLYTAEDDEDNYNTNDDIETDAYGGSASGGAYRAAQYEMEERFVYEDDYAASNEEDDTDDRRW